jgi:hypothetical protein
MRTLRCISGRNATNYQLWPCPNNEWCCSPVNSEFDCCAAGYETFIMSAGEAILQSWQTTSIASNLHSTDSPIVTSTPGRSTILATSSVSAFPGPTMCPNDRATVVGASIGTVLGAALIGALIVVVCLWKRLKQLKSNLLHNPGYANQGVETRNISEVE